MVLNIHIYTSKRKYNFQPIKLEGFNANNANKNEQREAFLNEGFVRPKEALCEHKFPRYEVPSAST